MSCAINNRPNFSETAGESEGQEASAEPIYYILYYDYGLGPCKDTTIEDWKTEIWKERKLPQMVDMIL